MSYYLSCLLCVYANQYCTVLLVCMCVRVRGDEFAKVDIFQNLCTFFFLSFLLSFRIVDVVIQYWHSGSVDSLNKTKSIMMNMTQDNGA